MAINMRAFLVAMVVLSASAPGLVSSASAATVTGCPTTQAALATAITTAGSGGTVSFNCAAATKIVFSSTITINQSVTLDGTTSHPVTFDGNDAVQLFYVNSGVNFTVKGLTFTRGKSLYGGVMKAFGTTTVENSLLVSNSAGSGGGGAALDNWGTMIIRNSTFTQNTGSGTISNGGTVTLTSSTVAFNNGTGLVNRSGASFTVTGSILAASGIKFNCNTRLTSGGYNLTHGWDDSDFSNCGLTSLTDIRKTPATPDTDPKLEHLHDNGGPTRTMALHLHSIAVGKIPVSTGICPVTDQRGVTRADSEDEFCDIGAFEAVHPIDIFIALVGGQYRISIVGRSLATGSTVSWHLDLHPHGGQHSGTITVPDTGHVDEVVLTGFCPAAGPIKGEASGHDSGNHDVTAHYDATPC